MTHRANGVSSKKAQSPAGGIHAANILLAVSGIFPLENSTPAKIQQKRQTSLDRTRARLAG
jgi:hypothetical protein